jgi:hypothetical protein
MRVSWLREDASEALEPLRPCSHARGREAFYLPMVRKGVHSKGKFEEALQATRSSQRQR